jgi:hypothetical protein
MANNYKAIKRTELEAAASDGGYARLIFFAPLDTFTTLAAPIAVPVALGDKKKIATDHAFGAADGFIGLLTKIHSVTLESAESEGDDGSVQNNWVMKAQIKGDSATIQEQLDSMKNDPVGLIFLAKDSTCARNEYIQLGDACVQGSFKYAFNSGNTKEGSKIYDISVTIKEAKYFYTGDVVEKPTA